MSDEPSQKPSPQLPEKAVGSFGPDTPTQDMGGKPSTGSYENTWTSPLFDSSMPELIGAYRILSRIGEGGIGVVYKAEQREPVKRIVALKIIKLGMDTREVVQRFAAERQALAMMDHPNVARVFDGGATPTGRPYFVMELVAGEPITEYCDRHSLSVRNRLELYLQVCAAVQHAHQKGIIHRDLKPSNILVAVKEGSALAKVIDFGIAKAINSRLTDNTLYTAQGQLIGTPEYMSPEQAEMNATDIDTRSDIYSLGVMLYELLAGAPPVDSKTLRSSAYAEIQRMIREVDPPSPSLLVTRMGAEAAKIAEHRRLTPPTLAAELKRELEWTPMKAMRKDRTERYQTATELASDIRNYLEGLPLIAGPVSNVYRARKFVKRNKVFVATVCLFMVMLAAMSTVSIALLAERNRTRHAIEETQRAEAQKLEAERQTAEAQRQRAVEERAKEAAMESVKEMMTQVSMFKNVTAEEKSRLLSSGVIAAMTKDPSAMALILQQLSQRGDRSTSKPTTWHVNWPGMPASAGGDGR